MDLPFPIDYEPEIDDPVFRDELGPWLPDEIFDFHSHIYREEDVSYTKREGRNPSMPVVCEYYPLENYQAAMQRLFPGKTLHALLFNTIDPNADMKAQNAYLAEATAGDERLHALMLCGLEEDQEALEAELRSGEFLGLKPYWSYVTHAKGTDQADVTLEDMVPPGQRELANRLGLIQMVHIPRLGRLADPVNVDGMIRLCEECPNSTIVMAHFGRAYFPEAIGDLKNLPSYDNLYVDFSMVQSWESCETLIELFGPDKILWGLDMPVAQEKGKLLSANGQRHFFTKRVHPWSIHNSAGSYKMRCTFYAYEIVRAFKVASERVGFTAADVEKVFLTNALGLVGKTRRQLGYE